MVIVVNNKATQHKEQRHAIHGEAAGDHVGDCSNIGGLKLKQPVDGMSEQDEEGSEEAESCQSRDLPQRQCRAEGGTLSGALHLGRANDGESQTIPTPNLVNVSGLRTSTSLPQEVEASIHFDLFRLDAMCVVMSRIPAPACNAGRPIDRLERPAPQPHVERLK